MYNSLTEINHYELNIIFPWTSVFIKANEIVNYKVSLILPARQK